MHSMTGYGKAEYLGDEMTLMIEVKTVNNRMFDFNMKAPRTFACIEDKIRKTVSRYISRGRIDLFVTFFDKRDNKESVVLNFEKAKEYYESAKILADKLGVVNDVTAGFLLKCQDVIDDLDRNDIEDIECVVIDTLVCALEKLNAMRKEEGEKLISDMLERLSNIEKLREKILLRAPLVAIEYKAKLKARIEEALENVKYDENRLLNEVAFYSDKVNIDEELTRLLSHINQFKSIVKTDDAGKKLDFLMQEFNRETNTICSKSNDIEVTKLALSMKNEIEKIREQVQNIE